MRPPLVVIPQFFGSLVFDRRTSRYMPFDHESSRVLTELRRKSIQNILAESDPARREAIADFYEYFYEAGYFDLNGRLAGVVLDVSPPADHLVGPLAVHLEIVAACNLTCTHCFAGELPRHDRPLPLSELDRLFGTLAGMGAFRLGLTGGEPLFRKDLFEVIDLATSHGLHPCLTTNGLLLTEEIAREFGKRDLVWLNVSLDGATAESNDRVRGAGTFEKVLEKLSILRRHSRFTLAFTIMSNNAEEVEDCARLAQEVGAHTAVFRPLYPVGVAARHPALMPTFRQYAGALDRLALSSNPAQHLRAIDPFSPHSRLEAQARVTLNNGCGAGNLICSISVNGDVNPCSFLGPEFVAANIRKVPFDHIWHESKGFQGMRSGSTGAGCSGCEGEEKFRGGCRARAQAFNGSIHATDPWHDEFLEHVSRIHPMSNIEHTSELL